jgi:hypothetical protein
MKRLLRLDRGVVVMLWAGVLTAFAAVLFKPGSFQPLYTLDGSDLIQGESSLIGAAAAREPTTMEVNCSAT